MSSMTTDFVDYRWREARHEESAMLPFLAAEQLTGAQIQAL
jgi:hypothetical protein